MSGTSGAVGFKDDTPLTMENSPDEDRTTKSVLGKYEIIFELVNVFDIGKSDNCPSKMLGLKSRQSVKGIPLNFGMRL